jgi:two-component system response regulator DevR
MSDTSNIRVFVLDDHEIVRRGISELLSSQADMYVVGEAASVAEAIRRIPACAPDVAVLDARLPDGSGVEVCRAVRAANPEIRCLILTSYDDDEAIFAAVLAGAAGYVLKQIRGSNLIDAVRQVAAGHSLLDPRVTERVLDRIRAGAPIDPRMAALNAQERSILDLIADGMTNRQIGEALFVAEQTVKNNVTSLLAKLGMQRRTQAAVLVAGLRGRPTTTAMRYQGTDDQGLSDVATTGASRHD